MVEHRNARARPLLLDEADRPGVHGRRRRRLGYSGDDAQRRRQRDQSRSVEVEGLSDIWAHVVTTAVAGHTEHRLHPDVFQSAQLLLQDDAIAVATRQGDPGRHPAVEQQATHQGGRKVRTVLVLTDKNGIAGRTQHRRGRRHVCRIERRAAEIGEDQRRAHRDWSHRGSRPRHSIAEGAATGSHLALAVGAHTAARPELHPLRTVLVKQDAPLRLPGLRTRRSKGAGLSALVFGASRARHMRGAYAVIAAAVTGLKFRRSFAAGAGTAGVRADFVLPTSGCASGGACLAALVRWHRRLGVTRKHGLTASVLDTLVRVRRGRHNAVIDGA